MGKRDRRSDEELLGAAAGDDEAFAVFYRRYERLVLAYFVRAVGGGELAADLTAETFAELVSSLSRFDASVGSGSGWLFGISRNVLARSRQRGRVEDRARRALSLPQLAVSDEMIERIERDLGDAQALELLSRLPEAQRAAIEAHVLGERDYGQVASQLACSESVVRQRVSRGLRTLRQLLREAP
jgi:RNA polymerase sigma factor (sigma-70 family)